MKTNKLVSIIFILTCVSLTANANDIWGTDGDFMDDSDNAKVQRNLAKQRALEGGMSKEELAESRERREDCGSLDVGNVQGGGKDVVNTTIIKGDVINVAGKCRATR